MKKQSNLVKGKCQDDGLSAATRKQRESEIMQQKQKKANKNPSSFVASCPTLFPFA
jgi:hypothetical protein